MTTWQAHFGGPEGTRGVLRDLLADHVAAVPPGGSIDWITYYFRDRQLATDLVDASRRGVSVRVTLDGHPRYPTANDAVIGILRPALADGLRVVRNGLEGSGLGLLLRARVHEKLYCFSHPEPVALVGSFNPSGDAAECAPEVIADIGDHDWGYNSLVATREAGIVAALVDHARQVNRAPARFLERFSPISSRPIESADTAIHFWPRVGPNPVDRWLARLPSGSRVRLAASIISGYGGPRALLRLARRGVQLEILTEATLRRVPKTVEHRLRAAGIPIHRVVHSDSQWIPMHHKFLLAESREERSVIFGSFNWSDQSRLLNRELGVMSTEPALFEAFASRWEVLKKNALTEP